MTTAAGQGDWIDVWLGAPRFARYLGEAGGDRSRALDLYEWNAELAAAFQHDIGHLEVALRNAYDTAAILARPGLGHWLRDDASVTFAPLYRTKRSRAASGRVTRPVDVNAKPRALISAAISSAGGPSSPQGNVVAELSLGFWRYLSSSAHEKALWVPMLHRAFPAGTSRTAIDGEVGRIHRLRNRIAHQEPLIFENLVARHGDVMQLAARLGSELHRQLQTTSQVAQLIGSKP